MSFLSLTNFLPKKWLLEKVTGIKIGEAFTFRTTYREIFFDKVYDFETEKEAPVIVDCGANIGLSVLFFKKKYPKAKIFAFEPHPQLFELLKQNTLHLKDVTLINKAVGEEQGSFPLYIHPERSLSGTSSLVPRSGWKSVNVEVTRIDQYVHEKIDMLKIDTEGNEYEILKSLDIDQIPDIIFEYSKRPHNKLSDVMKLIEHRQYGMSHMSSLKNKGFHVVIHVKPFFDLPAARPGSSYV